jgi:hypothetical protein
MSDYRLYAVLTDPRSLKAFADTRTEIEAIGVNAVTGMCLVWSAFLAMSLFTNALVILAGVLFGPLFGFLVSSIYPRIELVVGRRMGGEASLDELYRLFAWSFFFVGLAALLYSLLTKFLEKPGLVSEILLAVPSVVLVVLAARGYWSNLISSQRVTRVRGSVGPAITLALFVILIVGCGAVISLVYSYGASVGIKAF